jgi:hypothetical protein
MMTHFFRRFAAALALFFVLALSSLSALSEFYWEEPELFSGGQGSFPVSASSPSFSVLAWQEIVPNRNSGIAADGNINIHLAVKESGGEWQQRGVAGGPYTYSGTQPSILSMVIDNSGRIIIAAAASNNETEILISSDRGLRFTHTRVNMGSESSVAPKIVVRSDGGYMLFVTKGLEQTFSIYYARSDDAVLWSPFEVFVQDAGLQLNFLPTHGSIASRDFVVFQSFMSGGEMSPTFQLYIKMSDDGGATWTPARRFTTFRDSVIQTQASPDRFDNQRPFLAQLGDRLFLVWERRFGTLSPQIYSAIIDADGNLVDRAERVNRAEAYCNNPIAFVYEDTPTVVWFDNSRGMDRIFLAHYSGIDWQNTDLPAASGEASFGRPVVDSDGLYVFWQNTARNASRIYMLSPDHSVASPRLRAVNFTPSRRTGSERARISWSTPFDTSGIFGYSYLWTQDKDAVPPEQVQIYNTSNAAAQNMDCIATEDGSWYFSIIARDFAGNWSTPVKLEFIRDTTPPPAVVILPPETGDDGFLVSNNIAMQWDPSPAPDVAGYTWNLQYLGGGQNQAAMLESGEFVPEAPPRKIMGAGTSAHYVNQDDGAWAFSVSAIDEVGNIGPVSTITFKTNKYIPHTFITYVDARQDEQGNLTLRIFGRGFSNGGKVFRLALERAEDSLRREFFENSGDFTVRSDREIDGLFVEDLEEGMYRIILNHPLRGVYETGPLVSIARTGTVKFGDYSRDWKPSWIMRPGRRYTFDSSAAIISVLILLCALGIAASVRGISSVLADGAAVRAETLALITGDFMPLEKKRRITSIKRRGLGLRFKLASFTVGLVLFAVVMVSAPLYYMMTGTQRQTLLQGLWDRSTVLLEGLANSTRIQLPLGDTVELGYLPDQIASIPEARYVTITGFASRSVFNDHVWATNDPDILSKIDTAEFRPGVSRLTVDELAPRLAEIGEELNSRARAEAGSLSKSITDLNQEAMNLATRLDAESQRRLGDIQVTTRSLETRLTESLTAIAREIGSEPQFSTTTIRRGGGRVFLFFKPVMYRQGTDDNYFRGLIRLEVSIDSIIENIASGQRQILWTIFIIALAAIIFGGIAGLIFSTIIISPIRRLVSHVEIIRDTEDKSKLAGVDIHISTKDEIAILGDTINDMTHGLVKAAAAASDLSIGKEIQKKFIPLEIDREGNKLTSGYKDGRNVHFFGYYEGAKGVSGDYFDYQDLDGRYYAIIKCDVAGKGIPAALIMIQVATMFLNHFKQWKPTAKGMHIEELVYQINDFIETLGFKGRFAAFTLCIFDTETGQVRFCNAGDNIIHLYDASEGRVKTISLPETPATGVLPNILVESKGGYTVQTLNIDRGDILLLYTDGIEEAKRKFRDSKFAEIICSEGPVDTPHANHVSGQGDEEMGPDRVEAIINAVMNREVYTLRKWHNPEGEKELQFDFSSCEGKVEEVIMAMVSVEKMFRCYKDPNADADSRVLVDRKVDEFLKAHFLQYRNYCSFTRDNPSNDAYLYYTHVREDEQYDDLTILGIKRK